MRLPLPAVPSGVLLEELLRSPVVVGQGSPVLPQRELGRQLQRERLQLPVASRFRAARFAFNHGPQLRTSWRCGPVPSESGVLLEVPDYVPADWPNIYDPPCVRLDDLMPMEHLPVQISGRGAGRRLQRVGYPPQPATERSP